MVEVPCLIHGYLDPQGYGVGAIEEMVDLETALTLKCALSEPHTRTVLIIESTLKLNAAFSAKLQGPEPLEQEWKQQPGSTVP